MKNPIACFTLLLLLGLTGCDKPAGDDAAQPQPSTAPSAAVETPPASAPETLQPWMAHIESAPQGWVSAREPLKIHFTHPVTGDELPRDQPVDGVLAVEPQIELRVSFVSSRVLSIEFDQPLDRRVEYNFTLFPNRLDGIRADLAPYQFSVRPYQQDFGIQVDGLKIDAGDGAHRISGQVTTNDGDDPAAIEALLTASQAGTTLPVRWLHRGARNHEFLVSNVARQQSASEVRISWDGKSIGVDKAGELVVSIPAEASFEAVGAISRYRNGEYIEVNFSQPLDRNQSFRGLVEIQGQAVDNLRVDGNSLRVYPREKLSGDISLKVFAGIRSTRGTRTGNAFTRQLTVLRENPGVRFEGSANILPSQSRITIPIEAVNVDSVQVTAYEMKSTNLGQFLQSRNLDTRYLDNSTTAPLWRKTYRLPEIPRDEWKRFDLDVTQNFNGRNNDLLAFQIKINRSNIILDCGGERPLTDDTLDNGTEWPFAQNQSQPDWVARYYHSRGEYDWRDYENPCKDRYYEYSENQVGELRYFHTSSLGLIAKLGVDRNMLIVATDIKTGQALGEVDVVAYNGQHQPVARGKTGTDGMLRFEPVSAPSYLIANHGAELGFLRLPRNEALSTNVFDTGGEQSTSGIKGFFYGERGVWRPGDDIYLTFIAHDKTGRFPAGYPLTLDLFDPRGNQFDSVTQANPVNGFYSFRLKTDEDSPTGNWRAVVRYGGQYFSKLLAVEAIKPNRLKIELEFPGDELVAGTGRAFDLGLFSQWLNGASANRLKADVEMSVSAMQTRISGYDSFIFDDPARDLQVTKQKVFEGDLDERGRARFSLSPGVRNAPGKLKLHFTTRVFENSGNFSIQYASIPYQPYDRLVGINIPEGSGWNDSISRDDVHPVNFILVDEAGDPIAGERLELQLYRIGWRWWWDSGSDNLAAYVSSRYHNRLVDIDLQTDADGRASWQLDGRSYDWGRYLVRVCHTGGDHCSGKVVYLGWSYNQQKNPSGDTQLILSTDRDRYQVGDTARLTIPEIATGGARLLLTIESGTQILSQAWIEEQVSDNRLDIPITEDMAPNVYAHLTLIQGYDSKGNDSPIRMYGIVPLLVDDPKSLLEPDLELPGEVRPRSELAIKVAEKSGKAMTYTLAIVDEGLLGITNYRTPDPHDALFRREALGVMTWDVYDLVSRSSSFDIDRLLAIGGSDGDSDADEKKKKRRFPPVVRFLGPFTLAAAETAEHRITLPDYMGAVRVMLVAGDQSTGQGAYGMAEKSVTVTQPLTVLATLPRVLGPGESFKLPVNVFVNDDSIREVDVAVETNELFVSGQSGASLRFDGPGDKIVSLDVQTVRAIGEGVVKVTASSGAEMADQTIDIPVRSANLSQVVSSKAVLQPGESRTLNITPNGMLNTNETYFEVSRVPQINLQNRLDFLLGYPHGCLEQTTSKLFPQIYLGKLMNLSDGQLAEIQRNLDAGMRKFANFQSTNGEFSYWPGGNYSNQWSNSYTGHFLVAAKNQGYQVPDSIYSSWLRAQQEQAGKTGDRNGFESTDAYTLYTLALADNPDFNAMNRLKEKLATQSDSSSNRRVARWLLAAAYARAGVPDAAEELLGMADNSAYEYAWSGYTYGSKLRDTALLAMTLNRTGRQEEAWEAAQSVAEQLSASRWHSTHSLAWSLMALADYFDADDSGKSHPVSWQVGGGAIQRTQLLSPIFRSELESTAGTPLELAINNEGEKPFYVLLGNRGIPEYTREAANSSGVDIRVDFETMAGEPLDVGNIRQGEDFVARVSVAAADPDARLENLALSMIAPSGWEISNDRMKGLPVSSQLEYQDIRDDRVLSYFTLGNYYWWHKNNQRRISVEVTMNAAYAGRYYLPGWYVESMYDNRIAANTVGRWVNVIPR